MLASKKWSGSLLYVLIAYIGLSIFMVMNRVPSANLINSEYEYKIFSINYDYYIFFNAYRAAKMCNLVKSYDLDVHEFQYNGR